MNLTLRIWRQNGPEDKGAIHEYQVKGISEESSFLEMLDVLNEELFARGEEPVAFDSDCREGICGQCGIVINGIAHGPEVTTTCQLHMRSFNDGDVITIEPWRASGFPIIKDLVVNRSALDRIIQAGGYISVNTGAAPDAHATPVPKQDADRAFEAAACIGCGACVAACPMGLEPYYLSKMTQKKGWEEVEAQMITSCIECGCCSYTCPGQLPLTERFRAAKQALKEGIRP